MKNSLVAFSAAILSIGLVVGAPSAKITFGIPQRKELRVTKDGAVTVYLEVPVKITNLSTETLCFGHNLGPLFREHVRRRKNSKHWTEITAAGMCGVGYSIEKLAPGASIESIRLVHTKYSSCGYRLMLSVNTIAADQESSEVIKSEPLLLPRFQ